MTKIIEKTTKVFELADGRYLVYKTYHPKRFTTKVVELSQILRIKLFSYLFKFLDRIDSLEVWFNKKKLNKEEKEILKKTK